MRVITKNPNQLLIDAPQWLARIVGLIFFVVGVLGGLYFNSSFVIDCANKLPGQAEQCRVYNPVLAFFGYSQFYQKIDHAKIIARNRKGGKAYSLRLYADGGRYFLTKTFNQDRSEVKLSTDVINQYIQSSKQQKLSVPNFINTGNRLLFVFFVPFSLVFLYVASSNQLVLDKIKRQVFFQRKFLGLILIGKPTQYRFDEIETFELEESYSQRYGRCYQLMVNLKSGSQFAVNSVVNGMQVSQDMVKQLNAYIQP